MLDLAVAEKVVNRSGSWFKYNDDYLGQGKEKARAFLIENPEICEEIKQKVFGLWRLHPRGSAPSDRGACRRQGDGDGQEQWRQGSFQDRRLGKGRR